MAEQLRNPGSIFDIGFAAWHSLDMLGIHHKQFELAFEHIVDWVSVDAGAFHLCLELDDPGFDYSVLCEFRARLLVSGAERCLLEQLLAILRAHKLVKARGRTRTDSTDVVAAMR